MWENEKTTIVNQKEGLQQEPNNTSTLILDF